MIAQIINDSKAMEAEAVHDEEDAQKAYESFVQEGNKTVTAAEKSKVSKKKANGTAEGDLVATKQDLDNEINNMTSLQNELIDIKKECDFVQNNFDVRQEARDQEIEALKQAKSILSGAGLKEDLEKQA